MTPEQIALVQTSFASVAPEADHAGELFYRRLFEILPDSRPMFKPEMHDQQRMMMTTLATVVTGLDRFDEIRPAVEMLARRHVAYGVADAHYAPVGEALIWALEQKLGDDFTPAARAAWVAAYGLVADTMKAAVAA
jgi:hemoglobin-like flavoprotein